MNQEHKKFTRPALNDAAGHLIAYLCTMIIMTAMSGMTAIFALSIAGKIMKI